jgi:hypothetical protein
MLDVTQKRASTASFDWLMALRMGIAVDNVVLVTTSREINSKPGRQMREETLKQQWKDMVNEVGHEPTMCRFENTYSSAWTAIDLLIGNASV